MLPNKPLMLALKASEHDELVNHDRTEVEQSHSANDAQDDNGQRIELAFVDYKDTDQGRDETCESVRASWSMERGK